MNIKIRNQWNRRDNHVETMILNQWRRSRSLSSCHPHLVYVLLSIACSFLGTYFFSAPFSFSWEHLYAMCVMCTCWDVICVCAQAHRCTIVCIRMCTQGPQYIVYGDQRTWAVSLYLPSSEKGGFCLFFSPLRIAGPQASGDSPASTFLSSCRSSRIMNARYHNWLHMASGDLESGC